MGEIFGMSQKEIDRFSIIQRVLNKELTTIKAAQLLGITDRQLRKLKRRVKQEGVQGVISKHRGKNGNHRKPDDLKNTVFALIKERYEGYGPTLATEKLEECHGIKISKETLRQWMIKINHWIPKVSRKNSHLSRPRRDCFGELIQADGSHHHWFGEDLPACTAIVFVDDATSHITALVFNEEETTESYFAAMNEHINRYGIPRALYTDKYSVFKPAQGNGTTQFHRALKELNTELILANSPQAKGRIERMNRTLQDRLVKEFKLRGINTIEQANVFAKEYVEEYNKKFSKKPKSSFDAHRSSDGYDVERILSIRETRTILTDCSFQYNKSFFVIQNISDVRRMKGMKIDVYPNVKGKMKVFLKGKEVEVKLWNTCPYEASKELSRKEIMTAKAIKRKPGPSHPWRHLAHASAFERAIKSRIREEMELVI